MIDVNVFTRQVACSIQFYWRGTPAASQPGRDQRCHDDRRTLLMFADHVISRSTCFLNAEFMCKGLIQGRAHWFQCKLRTNLATGQKEIHIVRCVVGGQDSMRLMHLHVHRMLRIEHVIHNVHVGEHVANMSRTCRGNVARTCREHVANMSRSCVHDIFPVTIKFAR